MKKWKVQHKVDAGKRFHKKIEEADGVTGKLRPAYGSWPDLNMPFNTREKRHPQVRRALQKMSLGPAIGYKRKKKSMPDLSRVFKEAGGGREKLEPAYGSWSELRSPFNTREKRHPPFRPPHRPGSPQDKPVVHLDLLKHKRQFPDIRNSSQLYNLF